MSTVNKAIAELIIANNGYYLDDPRVVKIVTYNNQFNNELSYAILYERDDQMKYENSPACSNVRTIFPAQNYGVILARNFLNNHLNWSHQDAENHCIKYYYALGLTAELYQSILKKVISNVK